MITEFLNSDLRHLRERHVAHEPIFRPNLDRAEDIAKRHAYLLAKRHSLWEELPNGTDWQEVNVNEPALDLIRVFPRAQWRKLARGNYSVVSAVERLRTGQHTLDDRFLTKIAAIREQMSQGDEQFGTVILVGVDERGPLTVVDGNHRLVAALLSSPASLSKLRFMCGFSERMNECCWYQTDAASLFRYGKHVMARAIRNPKTELGRIFGGCGESVHAPDAPRKPLIRLAEPNDVQS